MKIFLATKNFILSTKRFTVKIFVCTLIQFLKGFVEKKIETSEFGTALSYHKLLKPFCSELIIFNLKFEIHPILKLLIHSYVHTRSYHHFYCIIIVL